MNMNLKKYLTEFEKKVFIEGFKKGVFGNRKLEIVPLQKHKLSNTPLGNFIGKKFEFDQILSINYYGFFKLSSEIVNVESKAKDIYQFGNIRSIKAPVIYISSVKIEIVKMLAPDLFVNYPEFKQFIVNLRWKKK